MNSSKLSAWLAIKEGRSPHDLGLGIHECRLDLRGLVLAAADSVAHSRFGDIEIVEVHGKPALRGAHLHGIDFTGSSLADLQLDECVLEDCVFDRCNLNGMIARRCAIRRCTFARTDLRNSDIAATIDPPWNEITDTVFDRADFRGATFSVAVFGNCAFRDCRLKRIDFDSSVFERCVFEGRLDQVIFGSQVLSAESTPPNLMSGVDFTSATFGFVEFRRIDVRRAKFGTSCDLVLVSPHRACLDSLLQLLEAETDPGTPGVKAAIEIDRRWALPGDSVGVLHLPDFTSKLSPARAARFREEVLRWKWDPPSR
ncbi:MAG: pentapeptide repeat-containing protein [Phycisphaeraceae bacterium]|nr:pentapeptide repeat-containing protein [Phycisphaeraceae bacterium]